MSEATRAEIAAVACAELFRGDGETVVSPMGIVPAIGAKLARLTFAPGLLLTDGEAYLMTGEPGRETVEGWQPFKKMLDTVVPHGNRHVVMGASQLDRFGNQNISAIGAHDHPTRQLLGVRGAPGNTVNHRTSYWVPKHGTRVFTERVDVVSGVGTDRATAAGPAASRYHDLHRVVTDLAVFDFGANDGGMRLLSVHPGVSVDEVLANTGFEPDTSATTETRMPTTEELRLIRDVLDPKSTRDKEVRT
ncbi:CoA-transferase [Haloechinothrix sp. LS1_15]|uniref:CoA-transferase subunit beta n=1 Tax=Haloechinothrix sp. LS1_15 TaxID=2652248 RepID=UPI0029481EE7|nr:CoA-transferase [Haloechinothrix sp. LS1_15]MDV6014161.1 CoA-transferase [Haloechinothrix sp. LS1_15]